MPWYSSIGLFKHKFKRNVITKYEERTVIVRAKSAKIAERKILAEFKEYCKDLRIEFLKLHTFEELCWAPGSKPVEVSSLMRTTDLSSRSYIDKYWVDLKPNSCTKVGWKHVWHNNDGKTSACYNCQKFVKGQLWLKKGGA